MQNDWREITVEIPDEPKKLREWVLNRTENGYLFHREGDCGGACTGDHTRLLELPAEPVGSHKFVLNQYGWSVSDTNSSFSKLCPITVMDVCWRCAARAGEVKE